MFSQLSDKLQDVFKELRGHGTISESNIDAALRQVRLALLEADVDFQVAKRFIARVKEQALGEAVLRSITPGQQIVKIFHDELTTLLGGDAAPVNLGDSGRILIVGLNGSGKTTSSAKLARLLKSRVARQFNRLRLATTGGNPTTGNAGKTNRRRLFTPVQREECARAAAVHQQGETAVQVVEIFDLPSSSRRNMIQELKRLKEF
jgi:signal recognition particle subunit SRP54